MSPLCVRLFAWAADSIRVDPLAGRQFSQEFTDGLLVQLAIFRMLG